MLEAINYLKRLINDIDEAVAEPRQILISEFVGATKAINLMTHAKYMMLPETKDGKTHALAVEIKPGMFKVI